MTWPAVSFGSLEHFRASCKRELSLGEDRDVEPMSTARSWSASTCLTQSAAAGSDSSDGVDTKPSASSTSSEARFSAGIRPKIGRPAHRYDSVLDGTEKAPASCSSRTTRMSPLPRTSGSRSYGWKGKQSERHPEPLRLDAEHADGRALVHDGEPHRLACVDDLSGKSHQQGRVVLEPQGA